MTPGERLRALRRAKGLSAADLAARVGKSESAVRNQENGTNGIPPGLAAKYARILGSSAAFLLYGEEPKAKDERVVPAFLIVRYEVRAGHWIEMDEFREHLAHPAQPVAPDPRYAEWSQWLELVVGDSVDLKIPGGGYAHVVDATEMGYSGRDGDWVVVERRRNGGQLRERTIKQLEITVEGKYRLWPRSTNPKWSEPLSLTEGTNDEEVEVEIVGLVIGAYSSFL